MQDRLEIVTFNNVKYFTEGFRECRGKEVETEWGELI